MKRIYSLKGRKLFKEIYSKGRRSRGKGIAVYVLTAEGSDQSGASISEIKIGITVGKRLGKAHFRNFIKRRIRAICSELLPVMHDGFKIIINPGVSAKEMTFDELKLEIHHVFKKAGLI